MLELNLKKSLLILSILTLNACVTIRDAEWCGDLGDQGATCFHTLTNETRRIEKADWDQARVGQLCTQSQSFTDIKTELLKLCKQTKSCRYQEVQAIKNFSNRVEEFKTSTQP